MHSRPLLDYLAYPEEIHEPVPAGTGSSRHAVDSLEARLKDLEAKLRAQDAVHAPSSSMGSMPSQDLTLSAQIEAILQRRAAPSASARHAVPQADPAEPARPARVQVEPPPTVPVSGVASGIDGEFLKFTEAVYLIGQAAKRFIELPHRQPAPQEPASQPAPSTAEIDALSAVLRETVSAFRAVADDLAVSAGEIRNFAAGEHRSAPRRRPKPARYREDDEIVELRESIADLQDRLDDLLHARRRGRY